MKTGAKILVEGLQREGVETTFGYPGGVVLPIYDELYDWSLRHILGTKAQDYTLMLGTKSLIPGFEEQLIGMHKGETRELSVTFPADYHSKELAGKDAKFTVSLKEVKKKVVPELNYEFAKDIGDHETVDELRTRLREDIEARKNSEQVSAQREELMNKLVEGHTFDVPESMVEKELIAMARSQATRAARQGMDVKNFDIAQFRLVNRELAVKRVKGMLILDAIAEREKTQRLQHPLGVLPGCSAGHGQGIGPAGALVIVRWERWRGWGAGASVSMRGSAFPTPG